jgi:hypothetical protein
MKSRGKFEENFSRFSANLVDLRLNKGHRGQASTYDKVRDTLIGQERE